MTAADRKIDVRDFVVTVLGVIAISLLIRVGVGLVSEERSAMPELTRLWIPVLIGLVIALGRQQVRGQERRRLRG